jgi:acetyltransferase-like isoleucine patch superfamily enzyme
VPQTVAGIGAEVGGETMAGLRRRMRRWKRRLSARLVHAVWRRIQQAGSVTAETDAARRFAAFGPGSIVAFPSGTIFGERWIEIGDRTLIGEQVSLSAGMMPGHDLGENQVLRIGGGCVIGRGSHIVAHHSIDIGDDVYTGPYVYITDQNHCYADPAVPVGLQWPVNAAVRIGHGCWLGTGVIVLPGSVLGRNVVVAAGSVVRGEFGDHCVIAGVPARVIKDFDPAAGWTRRAATAAGAGSMAGAGNLAGADVAADVEAGLTAEVAASAHIALSAEAAAIAEAGMSTELGQVLESVAKAMAADPLLSDSTLFSSGAVTPTLAAPPAAAAPGA